MEFKEFNVVGLFGLYNHKINFSEIKNYQKNASIIMIYGKNGIGKTTILRMIEGLMSLNFNVFREMYFINASLEFSNKKKISVEGFFNEKGTLEYLIVRYDNLEAKLDPVKTGAYQGIDKENVYLLRTKFNADLNNFNFEYIDTERLLKRSIKNDIYNENIRIISDKGKLISDSSHDDTYLSEKVKKFILDSQVWNSKYFTREEPDLFAKILANIESDSIISILELEERILQIDKIEQIYQLERLGIPVEKWDSNKLITILNKEKKKTSPSSQKLTIINSYLEVLETRNSEKISLAERILTFEEILNQFLLDKEIRVSTRNGFKIRNRHHKLIPETKLSTGEFHLLYLTVLALCTQVAGSVIAIDEPEMSMHISWQNKLIYALLKISSKANPQFIFATHSPDIAANYNNSLQTSTYER